MSENSFGKRLLHCATSGLPVLRSIGWQVAFGSLVQMLCSMCVLTKSCRSPVGDHLSKSRQFNDNVGVAKI